MVRCAAEPERHTVRREQEAPGRSGPLAPAGTGGGPGPPAERRRHRRTGGPSHVRAWFTPDVAVLELAVTALGLASIAGLPPLEYEGLRERYLPEVTGISTPTLPGAVG